MMRTRFITLGILGVSLLFGAAGHAAARTQQAGQPVMLMSGMQLASGTRYSVTILNPTQTTLGDLQVSVQLPADAVFDHALETPGFTQFAGNNQGTLSWNAISFAPTDAIDAFTFFLAQPSSGTFTATASWDGGGQLQNQFQPAAQGATDSDMDVTLSAASLAQGLIPVGNTGVFIAGAVGSIPDGTTVHVRVLGAAANPPAGTGDLWWCAIVEIDGLPSGTGLQLDVPTRQPIAPGAPVSLFTQNGDQWTSLSTEADVTLDGQYISYEHDGGVVAAGTASSFQSLAASGTPLTVNPQVTRQATINKIATGITELNFVELMLKPANCSAANCANFPPCHNTQFIAGTICANGSIAAQGDTAQFTGHTFCPPGGGTPAHPCKGTIGKNLDGSTAQAPQGTLCVFPAFTQINPFNCSPFQQPPF